MNYARVLLGGLVAGLLLNIGEWLVNTVVLAKQMQAFLAKCGMTPPAGKTLAILIVITFVLGIVIVFTYAAIRPRFGPGVKTAVIAGLVAWFCVYVYNNVIGAALGLMPMDTLLMILAWGFIEYTIAAIAGAWVYQEA